MKAKTLTEMLNESMDERADEAKSAFKTWLHGVDLPDYGNPEVIRKLLITLVDEP